jgi:AcrR family transcriptional regulator
MPKSRGRNQILFNTTHEGVLRAARDMFASEGYAAVATQRIAEAAGVSHGSVFHHFKSKRDLFIAVHQDYEAAFVDRVEAAALGASDPWVRFDRYWRAYIEAAQEPKTRLVLLQDGPSVIGPADLCIGGDRNAFKSLSAQVQNLMANGLIPARTPLALTLLIYSVLNIAAHEMAEHPQDKGLHESLLTEIAVFVANLR